MTIFSRHHWREKCWSISFRISIDDVFIIGTQGCSRGLWAYPWFFYGFGFVCRFIAFVVVDIWICDDFFVADQTSTSCSTFFFCCKWAIDPWFAFWIFRHHTNILCSLFWLLYFVVAEIVNLLPHPWTALFPDVSFSVSRLSPHIRLLNSSWVPTSMPL